MAILKIPVTKAGNRTIEFNTDELDESVYHQVMEVIVYEGMKVLLNKGMSKITTKGLEGDELVDAQDAAFKKGEENFLKVLAGEVSKGRASPASGKKVPGVVMTEARRLAKEVVKDEIRAAGMKVSHVEPSVITKTANEMIANDPSFIEMAQANIEARTAKVTHATDANARKAEALAKLEALGGITESPKLIAAANKAKAEKKTQLSAKQAGKAAPRKPKAEAHAGH